MLTRKSTETHTPSVLARVGFMRFGLGPKPGWRDRIGSTLTNRSLLDLCLEELETPGVALIADDILSRGVKTARFKVQPYVDGRGVQKIRTAPTEINLSANDRTLPDYAGACKAGYNSRESGTSTALVRGQEHWARYTKHLEPEVGFVERLVMFWSNHFSISQLKNFQVGATIGHFERNVIRKHVLGSFSGMLKAAIQHPAMLGYLDNIGSTGNNSMKGTSIRRARPNDASPLFNENLAREILELHTLGVGGGYSQHDVTNLAKILTGWTVVPEWGARGWNANRGEFQFDADAHEPGAFEVMGKEYSGSGQDQALAVMDALAMHPKTAEHISYKLLRHFVSERPSPARVRSLAKVFLDTGGDLKRVAEALLKSSESWTAPMNRIRPPNIWAVAQTRALGFNRERLVRLVNYTPHANPLRTWLNGHENAPWSWPTPDGFPEENYFWSDPNFIRVRTWLAYAIAGCMAMEPAWTPAQTPIALADSLFPGSLSSESRNAISQITDPQYGYAMLFMTPEFMRR